MEPSEVAVYCVTCQESGKQYIGLSAHGADKRWRRHVRDAIVKDRKFALQGAIRKHGVENFTIETLYVASSMLEARMVERGIIAERGTMWPRGYNMSGGGEALARVHFTPQLREKLRQANLGRKHSEDEKKRRADANRGRKRSPETRRKISEARRGCKISPEASARLSVQRKGRKPSPAAIEKQSAALRGRKQSPEFVAKRIAAFLAAPNKHRDKTHCPSGHAYTEENTYRHKKSGRMCRACLALRKRARRAASWH